jgi:hypothetical protein
LLAAALACGLLGGCAFSDPRISGSPSGPVEVAPEFSQTAAAATELETQAWAEVTACATAPWAGDDAARWSVMADVLLDHVAVLTGPAPQARLAATPDPQPVGAAAAASREEGIARADAALVAARDAHRHAALASDGVIAAFWASLAGSAEQLRHGLTLPYRDPIPADPQVTVEVTAESNAYARLVSAYHEAVFATTTAIGVIPDDDPNRDIASAIVTRLRQARDTLIGEAPEFGFQAPAAQGAYTVARAATTDDALALMSEAHQAIAEAAIGWVASTSAHRRQAVDEVIAATSLARELGLATAVWPGWPD